MKPHYTIVVEYDANVTPAVFTRADIDDAVYEFKRLCDLMNADGALSIRRRITLYEDSMAVQSESRPNA